MAAFAALLFVSVTTTVVAGESEPLCGDVNNSSTITTSDALLVLKKSVAQPITLSCAAYDGRFAGCQASLFNATGNLGICQTSLDACEAAPVCGNSILEEGEQCEVEDLDGGTCQQRGYAGGTLACGAGCLFDKSGCYDFRFDVSGDTIVDHATGLEWEKKTTEPSSGANFDDPHDVDNTYQWCAGLYPECTNPANPFDGSAAVDFLNKLNGGLGSKTCYAGHCDWRLPTVEELEGLPMPIGPDFQPDAASANWSATTVAAEPEKAILVARFVGGTGEAHKSIELSVRAVRTAR